MKLAGAFFKLIRFPNLLFIAITQLLFYFFIILPLFKEAGLAVVPVQTDLFLVMAASILIAAGGYIINDYFDVNIDQVNKPERMVVARIISRRGAMFWHFLLTNTGILLSFIAAWPLRQYLIPFMNIGAASLLWFYSTNFKKQLLVGNIIISLLTAWVVIILFLFSWKGFGDAPLELRTKLFRLAALYAVFAFIITLIREVVKDMEDREGDMRYGCRTMPIAWGIPTTRFFVACLLVLVLAVLAGLMFYVLQFHWWLASAYCLVLIIAPLAWIMIKLYRAQTTTHYHQLSTAIKLVMLSGILSMVFFV